MRLFWKSLFRSIQNLFTCSHRDRMVRLHTVSIFGSLSFPAHFSTRYGTIWSLPVSTQPLSVTSFGSQRYGCILVELSLYLKAQFAFSFDKGLYKVLNQKLSWLQLNLMRRFAICYWRTTFLRSTTVTAILGKFPWLLYSSVGDRDYREIWHISWPINTQDFL